MECSNAFPNNRVEFSYCFSLDAYQELYRFAAVQEMECETNETDKDAVMEEAPEIKDPLVEEYGLSFDQVTLKCDSIIEVVHLRAMVDKIEIWLKNNAGLISSDLPVQARAYISLLLTSDDDYEHKMAELGTLLYFLAQDKIIVSWTTSFLDQFQSIFQNQLGALREQTLAKRNSLILTRFAFLLLSPDEEISRGGIYAVKHFIQKFSFSQCFDIEHKKDVLERLDRLLLKGAMPRRLVTVSRELAPFVTIELGRSFPMERSVTSYDAKAISLKAFLSDLRQTRADCYGVAPLNFVAPMSPYKFFDFCLNLLTLGGCTLEGGQVLSALHFIKKILDRDENLNAPLSSDDIMRSFLLKKAMNQAFGLDISQLRQHSDFQMTVRDYIESEANFHYKSSLQVLVAKAAYYPRNLFQQVMLETVKFLSTNLCTPEDEIRRPSKLNVSLKEVICLIKFHLAGENAFDVKILELLEQKIKTCVWMDDASIKAIQEGNNMVFSNKGQRICISLEGQSLSQALFLFDNHRRLCFLKQGELIPIETISEFQEFLVQLIQEIRNENHQFLNEDMDQIIFYLSSKIFTQHVADYLASINEILLPVSSMDYVDSDLLLFRDTGGFTFKGLKIFEISTHKETFQNSDPKLQLTSLCEWLQSMPFDTNKIASLLLTTTTHACILKLQEFALLWKEGNVQENISRYIEEAGRKRLSQEVIEPKKRWRILQRCGLEEVDIYQFEAKFLRGYTRFQADHFRNFAIYTLPVNQIVNFAEAFATEMFDERFAFKIVDLNYLDQQTKETPSHEEAYVYLNPYTEKVEFVSCLNGVCKRLGPLMRSGFSDVTIYYPTFF